MFEYRFPLLMALATIGLILFGGVVHNTESSLACPDWPLCYGELLPDKGRGVWIEMGHRMAAAGVGLLTIIFSVAVSMRRRFEARIRRLAYLAVVLIIIQGGFGALTVLLSLPTIASTAHLAVSVIYLSVLIYLAGQAKLSTADRPDPVAREKAGEIVRWVALLVVILYFQMLLGAFVRHTGSGAAAGLGPDAAVIGIDPATGEHTLWPEQIPGKLNMLHRYFAGVVAVFTIIMSSKMLRLGEKLKNNAIRTFAHATVYLVILQVALGILSIGSFLGITLISAHLAVGTLLYAVLFGGYLYLQFLHHPYNYRTQTANIATSAELYVKSQTGNQAMIGRQVE